MNTLRTVKLSKREKQVLSLLTSGLSHKEIADHISRTQSTVSNTVQNIKFKVGLSKDTELVSYYLAKRYGLDTSFDIIGRITQFVETTKFLSALICAINIITDSTAGVRFREATKSH